MIGDRIRQRRTELGWTMEELAKKMGYSAKSTISLIENGRRDITQSKVVEFAKVLGVSIAYLMEWDESPDATEEHYYNDEQTRQIAQQIFESKELSLLFDAAKDAKPEDLKQVHNMLLFLKKQEGNEE